MFHAKRSRSFGSADDSSLESEGKPVIITVEIITPRRLLLSGGAMTTHNMHLCMMGARLGALTSSGPDDGQSSIAR